MENNFCNTETHVVILSCRLATDTYAYWNIIRESRPKTVFEIRFAMLRFVERGRGVHYKSDVGKSFSFFFTFDSKDI